MGSGGVAVDDEDTIWWKLLRWSFIGLIVFPFFILLTVLTFAIWFAATITGIGPAVQWCLSRQDDLLLDMDAMLERHKVPPPPPHRTVTCYSPPYHPIHVATTPSSLSPSTRCRRTCV